MIYSINWNSRKNLIEMQLAADNDSDAYKKDNSVEDK
jgi:hypothetical protein